MRSLLLALAICIPSVAPAAGPEDPPLERRAREIAERITAEPAWPQDLFHPELLKQLPPAQLRAILAQIHAACGPSSDLVLLSRDAPFQARFRLEFARHEMVLTVLLDPSPPHSVTGLFFGPPTPSLPGFEALAEALEALPGQVSFLAVRLGTGEPETVFALEPDLRLAVGSSFKLYVLGRLAADVAAGERRWSDVSTLDARFVSRPSGLLQTWPAGSPVTLHTLACLMISQSDNTATDHLIHALGRERVEAMLAAMGHGEPGRNVPLLATGELFKLRGIGRGEQAEAYLALDVDLRRKVLAEVIAPLPIGDVNSIALGLPSLNDRLEWFASTRDLCRAVDWLRRAAEAPETAPVLGLLGVQTGLATTAGLEYAGYKGGSTGGVLNHTWCLHTTRGTWLAVSATWNDTGATLDEASFTALAQRAVAMVCEADLGKDGGR